MAKNPYPIGTKLKLIPGTCMWGQALSEGHSDVIFEVIAEVDDGTSMARVTLRDQVSGETVFHGIDPHLFAPIGLTPDS